MAEYSKKTVAELQEILKSRNLASSGKKADLVARLTEADRTAENTSKPSHTFGSGPLRGRYLFAPLWKTRAQD